MTPLDEVFAPFPAVLSVEQCAGLLGRTVGTTYRLLQEREIPAYKVGGKWTIYKAELQAFLEAQRAGTAPPLPE